MTARDLIEHPEFVGQCVHWEATGRAFVHFADWFIDHGMMDHAAGWRWAAATGMPPIKHGIRLPSAEMAREAVGLIGTLPKDRDVHELTALTACFLDGWGATDGLSWDQVGACEQLLNSTAQVRTLGGYAGTGKTRVLSFLAGHLPRYSVCSFTGKVAALLRKKGVRGARTIHSTIYDREEHNGRVTWRRKHKNQVGDGFIVDEASMVSKPMLEDMLSFGKPIIAIGDHGQLPPVGEDAGLMKEPLVTLETVHRNAGPIARFAEFLRKGGEARDCPEYTPDSTRQDWNKVAIIGPDKLPNRSLLAADQIICAFNKTRVKLNKLVRDLRWANGNGETGELFENAPLGPRGGDRVMCLMNSGRHDLFNGQQGTILRGLGHPAHRGTLGFRPDDFANDPVRYDDEAIWVRYDPAAFNREKPPKDQKRPGPGDPVPFDYAYAVTAHKFIGDEADKVIVFEERCGLWQHARWAYTAASRARESLIWVTG